MPKNIEIKAKLKDFNTTLNVARGICNSAGKLLIHEDTFFEVPYGKLKLRRFKDGTAELISYKREHIKGPKVSDYNICQIHNSEEVVNVLKSSLKVIGVLRKERHLFVSGQTRIHLDKVENLGEFIELEVLLSEESSAEEGETIVNEFMNLLDIHQEDLICGAYIDSILNNL